MNRIFIASLVAVLSMNSVKAALKTQISYEKIPENIATGLDKFKCKGRLEKPGLLDEIGYSDSDLEKGVRCRKADFDGNGFADYWIYKCGENLISCKSKVILMGKDGLIKAIRVGYQLGSPDVFYVDHKKDHDYLEKFGCHFPKVDSLIELGDGDGRENRIYSLNKEKTEFKEVSHCTTVESSGN